jgi:hypothetical protein
MAESALALATLHFWWYPTPLVGGISSNIPSKILDSSIPKRTLSDNKKRKSPDFSGLLVLL